MTEPVMWVVVESDLDLYITFKKHTSVCHLYFASISSPKVFLFLFVPC